jgi:hypothetical protein
MIIPEGIRLNVSSDEVADAYHRTCVCCGERGHHRHHRWFRSQGGPDAWANSIYVCARCHHLIHHGSRKSMEALGWRCSRNGQWPALIPVQFNQGIHQGLFMLGDDGSQDLLRRTPRLAVVRRPR